MDDKMGPADRIVGTLLSYKDDDRPATIGQHAMTLAALVRILDTVSELTGRTLRDSPADNLAREEAKKAVEAVSGALRAFEPNLQSKDQGNG